MAHFKFYVRDDNKKYQYIRADENENAIKKVRYEYYDKIYEITSKELKLLNKLESFLATQSVEKVYEKMGKGKQKVVEPIIMTKEQYREMWLSEKYEGKPFDDNIVEIYTDRGERVRSKSEKIIADKLFRENIPYRYEYPLKIDGFGTFYPDFTILDEENRRNLIYEHLGMMDDERYANNAIGKLRIYDNSGYRLGDNLFITMETSTKPFDSRMLDGIIEQLKS